MVNRRHFLKWIFALIAGILTTFATLKGNLSSAWATTKRRIIEKGTSMSKLMHANPARIDTSRLETTPLEEFDVMGETTLEVQLETWKLVVDGEIDNPSEFNYKDILARPKIERNALLVCPGFFAYNGLWTGFSVAHLLTELGLKTGATHVTFSGSEGFRRKKKRYTLDEVLSDRVFAAYKVNGQDLPIRHGFPLRLVADDHRGGRWVKYLNHISVETR